jgi:hypothetical protein
VDFYLARWIFKRILNCNPRLSAAGNVAGTCVCRKPNPKHNGDELAWNEIKNPLNFVNNFSVVSTELIDELQDTLKGAPSRRSSVR